jgi:hypothetical protein
MMSTWARDREWLSLRFILSLGRYPELAKDLARS